MKSFNRRSVTRAGNTLNVVVDVLRQSGFKTADEIEQAVQLVNAVAYQYYLIPRELREVYFREELVPDGIRMHKVSQE